MVNAQKTDLHFTVKDVKFTMKAVPAGTFQMGNKNGYSSENPVHPVTLKAFWLGETEVTQELWTAVMGANPSMFVGNKLPVEQVSWDDCQEFITKLNTLTGKHFRLPTEAEWEYAARDAKPEKQYVFCGGNYMDDLGWYDENSEEKTHEVATRKPNVLGLYDMSGNVSEWCHDWYDGKYYASSPSDNPQGPAEGTYRVRRGGSWNGFRSDCSVKSPNPQIQSHRPTPCPLKPIFVSFHYNQINYKISGN